MMKKNNSTAICMLIFNMLIAIPATAATGSCSPAGGAKNYNNDISANWIAEQNVVGTIISSTKQADGNSYQLDCSCNATDDVNIYYASSTPLMAGVYSGYYKLNDNLDIAITVNDIRDGKTLPVPTKITSAIKSDGYYRDDSQNSVCASAPASSRTNTPVFSTGSNVTLSLYVTRPFLGELVIPVTRVATVQAAWSSTITAPKNNFGDIAQIYVHGKIVVPQSCTINQGDVIRVNLGDINATRFTTPGSKPDGYTEVQFNIKYDCGDMSKINNKLFLQLDAADVVDGISLVARRKGPGNVPDIGIQIINRDSGVNVIPFHNGLIAIDPHNMNEVHMEAYPVNLIGGQLQPGPFSGTATLTVIVR